MRSEALAEGPCVGDAGLNRPLTSVQGYCQAAFTPFSLTASPVVGETLFSGCAVRADLLAAISLSSVFMGANTYIGNGPNFMVKSIAETRGVKMPSFFGYMLYSGAVLIPLFVVVTLLFFA